MDSTKVVHLPVSKLWYQELLLLIWSAAEPVISAFILLGECPPPLPPKAFVNCSHAVSQSQLVFCPLRTASACERSIMAFSHGLISGITGNGLSVAPSPAKTGFSIFVVDNIISVYSESYQQRYFDNDVSVDRLLVY